LKVSIGPYKNWIGPYQIADALCFWVKKEKNEYGIERKPDWVHNFGTWLSGGEDKESLLHKFCLWVESRRKRTVKVKIDRWDTWSMDHTLSYIILPMLRQLKATKHGAPNVDDFDVPEHLQSTAPGARDSCEHEWDIDDNHFKRWDWIMDQMIFAHESKLNDDWQEQFWTGEWGKTVWKETEITYPNPVTGVEEPTYSMENTGDRECDWDGLNAYEKRIQNGFRLFGKYYQGLWD
jgi:hypothetical protein